MMRRVGHGVAAVAMVRNSRGKQTRGKCVDDALHDQINTPVRRKWWSLVYFICCCEVLLDIFLAFLVHISFQSLLLSG